MKRIHQRKETIKYYKQYFKPFPNYKSNVLSDGKQFVYRLGTLPLKEFIKIKAKLTHMINLLMNILSKDILPLKTSQKFSSVLEPYAVKVASTVLRGGCHREVMFLPDYNFD